MLQMDTRHARGIVCEYIWIGGRGEIRSKTRIIHSWQVNKIQLDDKIVYEFPEWNYDASSTEQADGNGNTEGILKPIAYYKNPIRKIDGYDNYLVLCETYDMDGNPLKENNRHDALKIFNSKIEENPWYGLEQEYFIGKLVYAAVGNDVYHYCGSSTDSIEREIAEKHMELCLEAGLTISGINAEVATKQWEFQIGPCEGIQAADQLIVARYLLERIAEQYNTCINFHPKPNKYANGSGCHTNFSTKTMRKENGIEEIYRAIKKLEVKHEEHLMVYGKENELRLTGEHETSNYTVFSWGKGTRNTSVRIPIHVVKNGWGYLEDRRPASNMDPYLVTSIIFKTCCL